MASAIEAAGDFLSPREFADCVACQPHAYLERGFADLQRTVGSQVLQCTQCLCRSCCRRQTIVFQQETHLSQLPAHKARASINPRHV